MDSVTTFSQEEINSRLNNGCEVRLGDLPTFGFVIAHGRMHIDVLDFAAFLESLSTQIVPDQKQEMCKSVAWFLRAVDKNQRSESK